MGSSSFHQREILSQDEARRQGAIGLFDEHYSGLVSIYRIDDKSLEFCGGPHVLNTRELGRFKIVKEQSVGAGLRRIRAVLEDPPDLQGALLGDRRLHQ